MWVHIESEEYLPVLNALHDAKLEKPAERLLKAKTDSENGDTARLIATAREMYAVNSDDDIEIDDDAAISEAEEHAFVHAWVYVTYEEAGISGDVVTDAAAEAAITDPAPDPAPLSPVAMAVRAAIQEIDDEKSWDGVAKILRDVAVEIHREAVQLDQQSWGGDQNTVTYRSVADALNKLADEVSENASV